MQNIKFVVRHPVPSLNKLFAMNPWRRRREKKSTQTAFAYALRDSGFDSSTLTMFARNTSSTAFATRVLSQTTALPTSPSKFVRKK